MQETAQGTQSQMHFPGTPWSPSSSLAVSPGATTLRRSALLPSWRPWTRPAASNCLKIPTRAALRQVPSSGNDLSGHQVSCCGGLEG